MIRDNNIRAVVVTRIIDGDTFVGNMYLLEGEIQFNEQHFRLMDVDTPERGEAGYNEATQFTKKMIADKVVYVRVHGKDSFGRWLVDVHNETSEKSLNEHLIIRGLAVPFEG